ncbi:hypothetical protein [Bacillus pumilus]|uniref:hypothetical protein n=1 Tax=Bacillus pumilus TaxID=1408 RepID=UPI00286A0449|nr:hypothetical protein [Bacillus pumilus]
MFCSRAVSLFSSSVTEGDRLENASAVNVGQNLLAEWQNSDKKNQGYGQNFGDASGFVGTKSHVDDRDQVDSPASFSPAAKPIQRK